MMMQLILFLFAVTLVHGRPDGAPDEACGSMVPKHGSFAAQNSISSYQFDAKPLGGGRFQVTLDARQSNELPFMGFFIQAQNSAGRNLGSFEYDEGEARVVAACSPEFPSSAVTHASPDKKQFVSLTWSPPSTRFAGPVTFKATVVQNFGKFWTGLRVDRQVGGQQQQQQSGQQWGQQQPVQQWGQPGQQQPGQQQPGQQQPGQWGQQGQGQQYQPSAGNTLTAPLALFVSLLFIMARNNL